MISVKVDDATLRSLRDTPLDVVVIGAGGWISKACIDVLHAALGTEAFTRRVKVLGSTARPISVKPGLTVQAGALSDWRDVAFGNCLLVHNAFLTRDQVSELPPEVYIERNRQIAAEVRALVQARDVRGIILPSSGAVYGADRSLDRDLTVNPYGALKVEDEAAFADLARSRGIPLATPRIFGLSGEYINKHAIYALASFIESARSGEAIRIRARHPVYRSYVYVGDLLALCLAITLSGEAVSETFDTAGTDVVEMGDLARLVARGLGRPDEAIERDFDPDLTPDTYVGERTAIDRLWRRYGLAPMGLREQIDRTAAYLGATAS